MVLKLWIKKFLLASCKHFLTLKKVPKATSWPAFRQIFRITGRYLKAGTSFLKRVRERIIRFSHWFHWRKHFLNNRQTNIGIPSERIPLSTEVIFRNLGKIFILWRCPFKHKYDREKSDKYMYIFSYPCEHAVQSAVCGTIHSVGEQ